MKRKNQGLLAVYPRKERIPKRHNETSESNEYLPYLDFCVVSVKYGYQNVPIVYFKDVELIQQKCLSEKMVKVITQ